MSASPASSAVQFECVSMMAPLDTNTAPVFDSQTASLDNNPRLRVLIEVSGIQPHRDISPDREIALNGGAS